MQRMTFAVVMMILVGFSGLMIESSPAQNTNSSVTMKENINGNMNNNGVRRRRRKHRKYGRHKMKYKMNKSSNGNANH